jgi:tripartite-type tricarboxylate transporter receptor subunit TctC
MAEEYPTKPIEIITGYTPGSALDLIPRLLTEIASKYLGQPMVVINKPGASGTIAAHEVVRSKPDGYKLMFTTNVFFATTLKTQKIPFDATQLIPIANFTEHKTGLVVRGDSPWNTLGDLLDYARKNPNKLRWAHMGPGTFLQLNPMLIFKKAGALTTEIIYKGTPECVSAVLGKHVDAASVPHAPILGHLKGGTMKYLVTYGKSRFRDTLNIPCADELGFSESAKLTTLLGIYAHKDTTEKIKKIIFDAFKKTFEDPEFQKGLEKLGQEPRFGGPEFIREGIKRAEEAGIPILKELGLYVEK